MAVQAPASTGAYIRQLQGAVVALQNAKDATSGDAVPPLVAFLQAEVISLAGQVSALQAHDVTQDATDAIFATAIAALPTVKAGQTASNQSFSLGGGVQGQDLTDYFPHGLGVTPTGAVVSSTDIATSSPAGTYPVIVSVTSMDSTNIAVRARISTGVSNDFPTWNWIAVH